MLFTLAVNVVAYRCILQFINDLYLYVMCLWDLNINLGTFQSIPKLFRTIFPSPVLNGHLILYHVISPKNQNPYFSNYI